jgi:hypothetical protein
MKRENTMIDLAISIDADQSGATVIETNHGRRFKAPRWPQDCEFQLVAFDPSALSCNVVQTESLAVDIAIALTALRQAGVVEGRKPDWFRRLERCSQGVIS